jgi:actin-related protein
MNNLSVFQSVYELPDGQYIHIDAFSRYRSTEILFNPSETDPALTKGIHELAYDAIIKCDNFLQRDLFRNVVVSGGTSMLEGTLFWV